MSLFNYLLQIEIVCPTCNGQDGASPFTTVGQDGYTSTSIVLNNGCQTCRGQLTIQKKINLYDLKQLLDGYGQ